MPGRRIFTLSLLAAGAMFGQTNVQLAQEETSFKIAVGTNPNRQTIVPELEIQFTLQHSGAQPLELVFPSGQDFDFTISNSRGEAVYTWSADKIFVAVMRQVRFLGKRQWTATFPLVNVSAGKYSVEGWLMTQEGKAYRAFLPFEIK